MIVCNNVWVIGEVGVIENGDSLFPHKLEELLVKPPIKKLWYRGKLDESIFDKCAAVVGSRRVSRYGRQAVEEIVPRLVDAGYTIVSGLMYGVDQLAHKTCVESRGRGIAVVGYGITNVNEEGADKLGDKLIEGGGLVLSEYEGEQVSQRWMFPQRNRIVVALAEIVIIVEAGSQSGSLGTAKLAREYGKKIYALPGPIFSPTSEGTNELIASREATALTLAELTRLTGLRGAKEMEIKITMNAGEREIYESLRIVGPQSTNELGRNLSVPARDVLTLLTQMEMKSLAVNERGVWRVS